QEAGFPMRMAVATVSGWGTGTPDTSGAAPDAWNPSITGLWPPSSQKPRQYALMLPALPTGRATASGTRPSSSAISKAAGGDFPDPRQGRVEISQQHDDARPVRHRLRQLPEGDLSLRNHHVAGDSG